MKTFIENNLNLVMLCGLLAGLFMPGLEKLPENTAIILISLVIFFSCSKISFNELKTTDPKSALFFYIFRFLLFPIVAFHIALYLVPDYAIGVLLVSLMPAGISSTAFANIFKGNPTLALSATVTTNALAPITIPLIVTFTVGNQITVDAFSLFKTLCLAVFVPSLFYFLIARKIEPFKLWVKKESQFFSISLIGLMIAAVVSLQKHMFFEETMTVIFAIAIGLILFLGFYVVAWLYPSKKLSTNDRKTYAICSGANNIALSAGIAVLYFSPTTILFCVLGEIPWIISVAVFERFIKRIT